MKNNAIEIQKIFRKEHKTYYEETKEIAEYLEKNFLKISMETFKQNRRCKMILSKEQQKTFEEVVRPLIKWLNDNCHPHISVVVDCSHAELSEGVNSFRTEDYWRD